MLLKRISWAALAAIVTVGCGGGTPATPAGPSPVAGPAGATILGMVQGAPGLAMTTGSAAAGLKVTVVGTDISVSVSGTGQFTLTGVPAGATQLRFTGPGVDATVTITPVQGSETITITVTIRGNTAEIDDEAHEGDGQVAVNGTISGLTGSASAFQFFIGSRMLRGDAQTDFFGDGNRSDSFSDLQNGRRVEVKGESRDGYVYAKRIHINPSSGRGSDDDDDDGDEDDGDNEEEKDGKVELTGTLSGLGGTCPAITFSVSGTGVATNSATEFSRIACAALRNGDRVKVEGARQSNGVVLAREVKRQ